MKPNDKSQGPASPRSRPRSGRSDQSDQSDRNLAQPMPQGDPFLPHERDQTPGTQPPNGEEIKGPKGPKGPRELIRQAEDDVNRGLRDTDLHGTPSDVPGPRTSRKSDQAPARGKSPKGGARD